MMSESDDSGSEPVLPRNIVEEFGYITDAFENDDRDDFPFGLVYAVIRGLDVYHRTGSAEQAVRTKEAYRIAAQLELSAVTNSHSELLYEAAELFATGATRDAQALCRDVAEQMAASKAGWNTEEAAVQALAAPA